MSDQRRRVRRPRPRAAPIAVEASAMIDGDRQVDLAGDDQQRHGEGDDRLFGEVEGRVGEVPGVEEIGRGERVDDEDRDGDAEQERLPALPASRKRPAQPVGDDARVPAAGAFMTATASLQDQPAGPPLARRR